MCEMGNPGKDFPCEVGNGKLSRGYYEFKPFVLDDNPRTNWNDNPRLIKIKFEGDIKEKKEKSNFIKYNPEVHHLIYDDGCMIEYWKEEDGVVTIYQMDWDDCDNCGFVCVELEELKMIIEKCEDKY